MRRALRGTLAVAALFASTAWASCDQSAVSPSATLPALPAAPAIEAALTFSRFTATADAVAGSLRGDFTIEETAGGRAVLESVLFEESGGNSDFLDAWCWGDAGVAVSPHGTLTDNDLGYCRPSIMTRSPGQSATITIVFRKASGSRETLRASGVVQIQTAPR